MFHRKNFLFPAMDFWEKIRNNGKYCNIYIILVLAEVVSAQFKYFCPTRRYRGLRPLTSSCCTGLFMRPFGPHVGPFRPQNTKSKFWANFLEPAVGIWVWFGWVRLGLAEYSGILKNIRNIPEYSRIFRNIQEYSGIFRNILEYSGIFRNIPE